ncbi:MAG: hydrogenase maturation protease [bacterium]
MDSVEEDLRGRLKGRVVVVGMGNPMRGDDGLGPILAENLRGRVRAEVIDAGVAPENYLGPIIEMKPDTVLILDAVHFGAPPGTIGIFEASDLSILHFSTHGASPQLFMRILVEGGISNVVLVGVQPQSVDLGGRMNPIVEGSMERLGEILVSILGRPDDAL